MVRFFKKNSRTKIDVAISELNGVRSLHLGGSMIQSAMRIDAPNELELLYTQCMMGFLLFQPTPTQIVMIGLGGGSLAKFAYHKMPRSKIVVIDNNQQVINTAINFFALPAEDDRFKIVLADGAQFIKENALGADILMIDGFDDGLQIASLSSQEFYNQAYQALGDNGILVVNLLSRDKNLNIYLQRISDSFHGCIAAMLSEVQGNLIVFAFKQTPGKISWKTLRIRGTKLEEKYHLPFPDFVSKLRKYTGSHSCHLEI